MKEKRKNKKPQSKADLVSRMEKYKQMMDKAYEALQGIIEDLTLFCGFNSITEKIEKLTRFGYKEELRRLRFKSEVNDIINDIIDEEFKNYGILLKNGEKLNYQIGNAIIYFYKDKIEFKYNGITIDVSDDFYFKRLGQLLKGNE